MTSAELTWPRRLLLVAGTFMAVRLVMVLVGFERTLLPHYALAALVGLCGGAFLVRALGIRRNG